MIELKNVTRRYQQGENAILALDDVSLRIEAEEFVAVTGESGSGKSTFLHLIGGLDKPDTGEVLVNGLALQTASDKELTEYRAHDLGIVFQFFNLLPTLNVLENVCLPLEFQGVKFREAATRAREMLQIGWNGKTGASFCASAQRRRDAAHSDRARPGASAESVAG